MYAYCLNNPVVLADDSGEIAITTIIFIVACVAAAGSGGYTAYVEYQAGYSAGQIIVDSLMSAISAFAFVYTLGMNAYQCYQNYCYLQGLTPVTQIGGQQNNITAQLQSCADKANSLVQGKGPIAGTYKHTAFSSEVNRMGNSSIRTEVSYLNGIEVNQGTKGSIRFDVVQYNANRTPVACMGSQNWICSFNRKKD